MNEKEQKLYEAIVDEVSDHLCDADATLLAECLVRMPKDQAREVFVMMWQSEK